MKSAEEGARQAYGREQSADEAVSGTVVAARPFEGASSSESGFEARRPTSETELRATRGWLDGFPLPAALVTEEGDIGAASKELLKLASSHSTLIGASLPGLLWPESREAASRAIAASSASAGTPLVTLTATGHRYSLHVGAPLGRGTKSMRLAMLCPAVEATGSGPKLSSIPAPPPNADDPLRALSGLPIAALVVADGRVTGLTQRAAAILAVVPDEFVAVSLAELLGSSAADELFQHCSGSDQGWRPRTLPAIPVRIDGSIRATACCLLPFGRPNIGLLLLEGWNATMHPSDPASRASSASYLIAGVAHEINNPLTFVLPALRELAGDFAERRDALRAIGGESWLSRVAEAIEGVERIAGVVQNLRAAREAHDDTHPTLVNQVIASTLRLAAASMPTSIVVRRDLGLVLPARANRQRLSQVLLNLVVNASQALEGAGATSGTILVRSWSDMECTWVEVCDNGPGVAPHNRERIFEPFFTTRPTGSGLGLAVCRAMIRELGGELSLEPTTRGACFRLRLLNWQGSDETEAPTGRGEGPVPRRVERCRILLVDDDAPVRRALRRMLAAHHEVDEAGSADEAFEKAEAGEYDVLITDLVMSHGGGAALIERLKQAESPLASRVIIISGMAPDATPSSYPRITKPCTVEQLLNAIESIPALRVG